MRKEERHMELGKKIGAGATADLYQYGKGKLFKKFHDDKPDGSIQNEYECTKAVQGLSIKVPKLYEIHLEEKNRGIVMEYLQGKSMLEVIFQLQEVPGAEKQVEQMCREFARTHYEMHQMQSLTLPDGHEWLIQRISSCEELSEKEKEKLEEALYQLPKGDSICHNDYHPGNLIQVEGEFYVIDWCDASSGNPWMDIARTKIVFDSIGVPEGLPLESAKQLNAARRWMGEIYLEEYMRLSGKSGDELKLWIPIVAASRLSRETGSDKEKLLTTVKAFLHSQ